MRVDARRELAILSAEFEVSASLVGKVPTVAELDAASGLGSPKLKLPRDLSHVLKVPSWVPPGPPTASLMSMLVSIESSIMGHGSLPNADERAMLGVLSKYAKLETLMMIRRAQR